MYPFIILCGGLATRLGSIALSSPKCLLEVNNKPFLYYQLSLLEKIGPLDVYLSVGHLSDRFDNFLNNFKFKNLNIKLINDGPVALGTGGAVKNILKNIDTPAFVMYGDSFLRVNFVEVFNAYDNNNFFPSRANYFHIFANFNNDNIAEEFLAFNSKYNYTENIMEFISTNEPIKNSSQIEISNNSIRFFVPEDFNRSKTPFSNQQGYKIEKFEERLINCKNGVYKINLYKDEVFEKNLETQKILEKNIQRLVKENQEEEARIEKKYDYERDGSDLYEEKISILDKILDKNIKIERLKNPIEELGGYFYHIKLKS